MLEDSFASFTFCLIFIKNEMKPRCLHHGIYTSIKMKKEIAEFVVVDFSSK